MIYLIFILVALLLYTNHLWYVFFKAYREEVDRQIDIIKNGKWK